MRILPAIVISSLLSLSSFAQIASHDQIMQPPAELKAGLYPADANARKDIQAAVAQATKEHKRIILDFGADWCLDCHILDNTFHHNADVSPLLEKNFVVVHIDIGRQDPPKNNDVAIKYHVPLEKGVPALAVLESNGKLLYSDKGGEFEAARRMKVQAVIDFLEKWRPKKS
jgi:thiol:disulfide interchange protein